jgi:acyl-CoA synthetase (AMP-forming)/AMP-acid ligase II
MTIHFRFSSITGMLQEQAQSRAHQTCLLYPDQTDPHTYATLTYKQLNEVTNHIAQKFAAQVECSPTNEVPIVCLLANSNVSYLLSIYALLKLNVIVYPLSIRNSDAAILHLLENSHVSHLFYSNQYSPVVMKIDAKFGSTIKLHLFEEIRIAELLELGESSFKPTAAMDELEQVRIIFHRYACRLQKRFIISITYMFVCSSGSTSFPKAIRLATRCLFGYFETYALEMNKAFWTDEDTVLAVQPL